MTDDAERESSKKVTKWYVAKIKMSRPPALTTIQTPFGQYAPAITIGDQTVSVEIRPFRAEDLEGIRAWEASKTPRLSPPKRDHVWQNFMREWLDSTYSFEDFLRDQGGWAIAISHETRILGMVVVLPYDQGSIEIDTLQSCPEAALTKHDPQHVGGIGTALLVAAIAEVLKRGLVGDIVAVATPESEAFYRKMQKFRTTDQPGLVLSDNGAVRFSPEGARTFLAQVVGGIDHERND